MPNLFEHASFVADLKSRHNCDACEAAKVCPILKAAEQSDIDAASLPHEMDLASALLILAMLLRMRD